MSASEDRRSYDPWAPAPVEALTGVVTPMVDEDTQVMDQNGWPDLDEVELPEPDSETSAAAAEIPADLDDITLKDLKALAELAGVATYGSKADVADRIRAA